MIRRILIILIFAANSTIGVSAPSDPVKEDSIRRAAMAEIYFSGDREEYIKACRDLIDYHERKGNDKLMFDACATLFERLQMWGMNDEALTLIEEISTRASSAKSVHGEAVAEFCFGHFYLNNKQPHVARVHYMKAFEMLQHTGDDMRAMRTGFNLQAVAMNLDNHIEALAINDSTDVILHRLEAKAGHHSIINRLKQARYRYVVLLRLGRMNEAAVMKDTMLHYAALLNDPSQDEIVYTALIQGEQSSGNKKGAYDLLDTLIERNLTMGNYTKAARFRLTKATYQGDNGDFADAVESYRLYAAESDSARLHSTNEQLNELSKKYELANLRAENLTVRRRILLLGTFLFVSMLLTFLTILYTWITRRKNKILYEASLEVIKKETLKDKEMTEAAPENQQPEERLYASILSLITSEELFKVPEMNRDILSERLGTNRTYLSEAVKKCSGLTVSNLINHYRLRWAAENLVSRMETPVYTVGEEAGFTSRSTFYRLFMEQYGMSPMAYRIAAADKRPTFRRSNAADQDIAIGA